MTTLTMSANRPQQIVDGIKTLTCRPVREGDTFRHGDGKTLPNAVISGKWITKWKTGGVYGIKPGRIAPVCLVDKRGKVVVNLAAGYQEWSGILAENLPSAKTMRDNLLKWNIGYSLLQVRVLEIRRVNARDITHEESLAEGFNRRSKFWQTWCELYDPGAIHLATWMAGGDLLRIHLKSRPAELYDAWMLRFERVQP